MEKILATIFLVVAVWWTVPHIAKGEWFAPTLIAPQTWMADFIPDADQALLATPPSGYGISRFDFWNNPPSGSRPVTRNDLQLQY